MSDPLYNAADRSLKNREHEIVAEILAVRTVLRQIEEARAIYLACPPRNSIARRLTRLRFNLAIRA